MTPIKKLLLALVFSGGAISPAYAGEFAPISTAAFQAARAANKPILFHIRTKDGAICRAQHAVLEKLMAEAAFKDYVVLEVDFTANPQAVKMLGATLPATLIFDRAGVNIGRLQSVTDEAQIRALLLKT